jgi:hypothetical protein
MRRKPRLEMHEKEVKPGEDIEMAVVQDGFGYQADARKSAGLGC